MTRITYSKGSWYIVVAFEYLLVRFLNIHPMPSLHPRGAEFIPPAEYVSSPCPPPFRQLPRCTPSSSLLRHGHRAKLKSARKPRPNTDQQLATTAPPRCRHYACLSVASGIACGDVVSTADAAILGTEYARRSFSPSRSSNAYGAVNTIAKGCDCGRSAVYSSLSTCVLSGTSRH